MQKNPVNKDREEQSISSRTTPMHLNQGTNKKMRKANRSISNQGIQNAQRSKWMVCRWEIGQKEWQAILKKKNNESEWAKQ